MQTMNKIVQQQQPISQIPQVVDVEILWKLIENLERGINSTNLIKVLIAQDNPRLKMEDNDDQHQGDYYTALVDHHSMVCLDSYATSLSMLKSLDFDGVFARKRKLEDDDNHVDVISQGSTDMLGSPKMSNNTVNSRRGCNKRRKNGESREEEVSQLTDDGFVWRKYGQKLIHNFHQPRYYYRCTHKNEQKCKATKQVQQVSDKPTKYIIIYHFNHTCNSILKTSSSMIDFPEDHPSAFVLSFVGSNQQVNPMLFPTSTFPTKVAELNIQNNSPSISSIYNPSISQNSTATTTGVSSNPKSEQCTEEVSVTENYCSASTSFNCEEDYSFILAADYSDLLPDWWTS